MDYGTLTPREREAIVGSDKPLIRLKGDRYMDDTRISGDDYCWQCGHIATKAEFTVEDKCPNPNCPRPKLWND